MNIAPGRPVRWFLSSLLPVAALAQATNTFPTTGNAGAGTASPTTILTVAGSANTRPNVTTSNGSGSAQWTFDNSSDGNHAWAAGRDQSGAYWIEQSTGATFGTGTTYQRFVIDTSGNIGLGTTTPAYKLDVAGDIRASGNLILSSATGTIVKNGAGRMDIGSVGGIITDNPFWRGLHLYSPMTVVGGANEFPRTSFFYSATTLTNPTDLQFNIVAGNSSSNTSLYLASEGTGALKLVTNSAERLRIDSSGNVGIGVASPGAKLEVQSALSGFPATTGTSQPYASARFGNVQTNGVLDLGVNSAGGAWLQYTHKGDLSQSFPLLLNPNGGNVGVGTTSPGARFEVQSALSGFPAMTGTSQPYASARFGNVQTNGVLDIGVNSSGGAWLQYTHKGDLSQSFPLLLNPNGGNVGIGTTNPGTYKLAVVGKIHATEIVVETGWSDYVFADDYRLAPLSEVEAHIKAEKHLPGIPSATEVAQGGVSVGDMQAKLLAKLEEVTLHLIAQEKRIALLEQENAALRSKSSRP